MTTGEVEKNIKKWLPLPEFWYNSYYNISLGCTPFKALYGIDQNFCTMPTLEDELHSSLAELATDRVDFFALLREHLRRAHKRVKAQDDKHHHTRTRRSSVDRARSLLTNSTAHSKSWNELELQLIVWIFRPQVSYIQGSTCRN